jgi:hypothetical protein
LVDAFGDIADRTTKCALGALDGRAALDDLADVSLPSSLLKA